MGDGLPGLSLGGASGGGGLLGGSLLTVSGDADGVEASLRAFDIDGGQQLPWAELGSGGEVTHHQLAASRGQARQAGARAWPDSLIGTALDSPFSSVMMRKVPSWR